MGGKYKLLPQIIPLFPKQINCFVDLFCGGCNVACNLPQSHKIVCNDNLIYMIDMYEVFYKNDIEKTLKHIDSRVGLYRLSDQNQNGYLSLRAKYNAEREPLDLFVLIAYSFNHQIRFNSRHEFNTPFGRERSHFNDTMRSNLIKFVTRIKDLNIEFSRDNFDKYNLSSLDNNDFVYCDPPYLITDGSYNDGKRGFTGWTTTEEIKLLDLLEKLDSQGVRFALSNVLTHDGKKNTILADWCIANSFCVTHLSSDYSNSSYHKIDTKRGSDEVLITNYQTDNCQQLKLAL